MPKRRLSSSVDAELITAAAQAVANGEAETVSAWVNAAMRRQADHDRRLRALAAFVRSYERKHGLITDDEITAARRRARSRAVVVRPRRRRSA